MAGAGQGVTATAALAAATILLHHAAPQGAAADRPPRGAPYQVELSQYDPLFSNEQIVRRLLSPLSLAAVHRVLARSRKSLPVYPLDLAKETFLVYVPPGAPPSPHGFALLVFIPPWRQARLPFGWASQLDRYGFIFVTPASAGNTAVVLSRRVPLALAAETNIAREYPIDPSRIYVGGFSGGSRVALRVALGYPDVFRGALLHAGADPLGNRDPVPPRNLFMRFQNSTRLVYITGERDPFRLAADASSLQSMRELCVFDVETTEIPYASHQVMSSQAFGRALEELLHPVPPDPGRLGACRSRIRSQIDRKLAQAAELISKDRRAPARKLLLAINEHYGGLAAPRIVELARRCRCGLGQQ